MSIPIDNYIKIISSTVGGAALSRRSTEFRMISSSSTLPVGIVVEFSSQDAVGSFFGYASNQYIFAGIYFGFVSKSGTMASSLSWFNAVDAAAVPSILGVVTESLSSHYDATLNITLSVNGAGESIAVDTTGDTSSADVAASIATAMALATDPAISGGTCEYDVDTTRFSVIFSGTGKVSEVGVVGDDAAGILFVSALGLGGNAYHSLGQASASYAARMDECANLSNDFFTFGLFDDVDPADFATWADGQNNTFAFLHKFVEATYLSTPAYKIVMDKMLGQSGNALTQSSEDKNFSHFFPAIVCAATDYSKRNAAKNYMYQQDGAFDQYAITTELQALSLKALGVNFYGQTQSAGDHLAFYQWGVMSGGSNDIKAQGPFMNEIWLKDAFTVAMMNVFIANENLTANTAGVQLIENSITPITSEAKFNGVIQIDKDLTDLQKGSITQMTGDPLAWGVVQSDGFWLEVKVVPETDGDITTYVGEYLLVYSKGDSISKIDGRNVAI